MIPFILKRIFISIPVIFVLATITFCIMRITPGGPFDKDKAIPPEIKANIEAKYHLDRPLWSQYFYYMKGLIQGDLGPSYKYLGRSVTDIIKDSLPVSVELGLYAAFLAFLLGIPLGIIAAYKHGTWLDSSSLFIFSPLKWGGFRRVFGKADGNIKFYRWQRWDFAQLPLLLGL